MNIKKKSIYVSLSLMIVLYAIFKNSLIPNEEVCEWTSNILKIPFIYFFIGFFFPKINMKYLLLIILAVLAMGLLDFVGNSFTPVFERIVGNLIGGGVLGLILYLIDRQTNAKD